MALATRILEIVVFSIKMISVVVLLVGLVICIKKLVRLAFPGKVGAGRQLRIQIIKNDLGWFVLLGLEILIIADIIETIINPSLVDIIRLAAIVAIRTVISHFLNKEIKETDSILEQQSGK